MTPCKPHRQSSAWVVAILVTLMTGCTSFAPQPLSIPEDLGNVLSHTQDQVTVSAGLLTDGQARRHFGVDLGKREIQAAWIRVRNESGRSLWFIRNTVDPDFYSADEVTLMVQGDVPAAEAVRLRQTLRDESIRVALPPATVSEGFLFLPKLEGGRFMDITLQGDAWNEGLPAGTGPVHPRELHFGLAIPLPDGEFDYERLASDRVYGGRPLPDLDATQFRAALESLPCCTTDLTGTNAGDPLNLVLVGEAAEVMHVLSRSGWSFTHRLGLTSIGREIVAAVTGAPYLVAPVSQLYTFGRGHDLALQRARRTISQRNHLRLWLAPFRFEGRSVWVGQVSRDIGVKLTTKSPTLTTHVIDPEVDATREYLLHSLLAQRGVARFGFVGGSGAAPRDAPRLNLTDDPYFSDGMRLVMLLSAEPVPADAIRNLMWERSGAPIAEGQSAAAAEHVRAVWP
ncbi:MAG: LssY C-terminal domain-containing protein [Zoogloeaceae bacterium]|nr:LssY C-terminal domain-containing protein [Zoogloeaceae bacterium]